MLRNHYQYTMFVISLHALLLIMPSLTLAGSCKDVEKVGYDVLPPYCEARCKYSINDKDRIPAVKKWSSALGHHTYVHLHHYCFGLAYDYMNNLGRASGEYSYVLHHWPKDSVLRPMALYKKALVSKRRGNTQSFVGLLREAINAKPNFTPPYAELSDWALGIGEREKAVNYLKEGLSHNPASKLLADKLKKIQSN